ncbi:MAG TPA: histidine kinase dimerization/phospho-acceptor domain-containing protein, partial [Anaerolineales bacterium]|nr:histidine kinase dimerization/phospho-acceptor domain-containing protein [Anaerolineales bacterium]
MNSSLWIVIVVLMIIVAWYAWRYYNLRRNLNDYVRTLRQTQEQQAVSTELESLSSAVASLVTTLNTAHAAIEAERARLATVLDQMTDGVLIADSQGLIQFANPAAGRLFQTSNPTHRSLTEVIRNHQLVEAWRRCQQTGQMQTESVEVPTRHQFLQLVVIPDTHASGSLLLVQDLTRLRRLETVRRDFVSNLSHELRTPLASLKALAETLHEG